MGIFNTVDFELPTITQRVLSVWHFFRHWWPVMVGGVACAVIGTSIVRRTPRGRFLGDLLLLRLPVVGSFVHKLALSRFARHFALLFAAGTDLLKVLELLQHVVGNASWWPSASAWSPARPWPTASRPVPGSRR
jgi:type II secretory pathway component PulF